ncbi:MAG: hypothetical protein CM15mP120_14480 [Pseudomonadota bacterium]|nr:MAG: hypothetical protein CM15mP120_14480 [Pseudomonadota bacterium]
MSALRNSVNQMFYDRYTSLPGNPIVARSFYQSLTPLLTSSPASNVARIDAGLVLVRTEPGQVYPHGSGDKFFKSAPRHQLPEHLMSRDDGTVLVLVALGLERSLCGNAYVVGLVLG